MANEQESEENRGEMVRYGIPRPEVGCAFLCRQLTGSPLVFSSLQAEIGAVNARDLETLMGTQHEQVIWLSDTSCGGFHI